MVRHWLPMPRFGLVRGMVLSLKLNFSCWNLPNFKRYISLHEMHDSYARSQCKLNSTKLTSYPCSFFRCPTCDEQTRMHPRTYKADEIDNMLLRELRKVESSHVPKSTSSPKDIYWHHMLAFFKADSSWWMGRRQCFVLWEEPVTLDLLYRQGSFR